MMDLQSALNAVQPGQSIVLEPGRVYEGPFRLPRKVGSDWITIRTGSAAFAMTVPAGRRVRPADARMMPKLIASRGNVIEAEAGAHHYRFIGLEVAPAPGVFVYHVIDLGTDGSDPAAIPHDFDFQRMYVHGDPAKGSRRGFALNSASTTIVDSYISDFKEVGQDSQAICGWNGPGPFTITNNYLEGAGENLMFGGGDPTIRDLVPSDIQIRRNTFSKPLEWRRREGTPAPDTPTLGRQERAGTEERPARRDRRQHVRAQLARRTGGLCHRVHTAQPGWRFAVVRRRGRHVQQQHRPARGGGREHPGLGRHP
jgi:hypothetical protein